MATEEKDSKVYCHDHEEYKIKNMGGAYVCPACIVERHCGGS